MDAAAPAPVLGDRYELGPVLATGGTVRVHRAYDRVLGREVAVKVFRLGPHPQESSRIEDEIRVLAGLHHPGLVRVHDASGTGEAEPYLVLELVDGRTLAQCCADGSLAPDAVAGLGTDVAEALAFVHARGVVHRDVEPANVLLGRDGRTRLAEPAIARPVDGSSPASTPPVGAPPYRSPELAAGRDATAASDVYALGLVLLEALTGRRQPGVAGPEGAPAGPARAPEIPADLPTPWPSLLARMTAADPAQRPSAGEVARALRGATGPAQPPPPRRLPPPAASSSRRPEPSLLSLAVRDRVVWVLAGSLALVLLAVTGAVLALSRGGTGDTGAVPAGASSPPAVADASPAPRTSTGAGPAGAAVPVARVALFHPGGSGDDHPEEVPLAADGDPGTAWTTQRYASRDFGNLRPGVGLRFDLGSPRAVRALRLVLPFAGADVRVHAGGADGEALLATPPVTARAAAPAELRVELTTPVTARYWVVWLERLPDGGRGGVAEVAFAGA